MLLFNSARYIRSAGLGASLVCALALGACTVQPLATAQSDSSLASGSLGTSTSAILASTDVSPVTSREGQQVRNALLFAMNGGSKQPGGNYKVDLDVTGTVTNVQIERTSVEPVASQVVVKAVYQLKEISTGRVVHSGTRTSIAAYDRTSQSFANERAQRDAINRASRELAHQIKLALSQAIAAL